MSGPRKDAKVEAEQVVYAAKNATEDTAKIVQGTAESFQKTLTEHVKAVEQMKEVGVELAAVGNKAPDWDRKVLEKVTTNFENITRETYAHTQELKDSLKSLQQPSAEKSAGAGKSADAEPAKPSSPKAGR